MAEKHIKSLSNHLTNDTLGLDFEKSEKIVQTWNSDQNGTKILKLGKIQERNGNQTLNKIIHETSDGNGNPLTLDVEKLEMEKNKNILNFLKD